MSLSKGFDFFQRVAAHWICQVLFCILKPAVESRCLFGKGQEEVLYLEVEGQGVSVGSMWVRQFLGLWLSAPSQNLPHFSAWCPSVQAVLIWEGQQIQGSTCCSFHKLQAHVQLLRAEGTPSSQDGIALKRKMGSIVPSTGPVEYNYPYLSEMTLSLQQFLFPGS